MKKTTPEWRFLMVIERSVSAALSMNETGFRTVSELYNGRRVAAANYSRERIRGHGERT